MFENEEWAEVAEFPQYMISTHGRIKHKDRNNARQVSINNRGFPVVSLRKENSISYLRQINQLVAAAFLPRPGYNETSVIHIDGDLQNCHYTNLRWATRSEAIEWNRMRRAKVNGSRPKFKTPPVRNNWTGAEYDNAYECAIAEGKLESDLVFAIESHMRDSVWDPNEEYCYIPFDEYDFNK